MPLPEYPPLPQKHIASNLTMQSYTQDNDYQPPSPNASSEYPVDVNFEHDSPSPLPFPASNSGDMPQPAAIGFDPEGGIDFNNFVDPALAGLGPAPTSPAAKSSTESDRSASPAPRAKAKAKKEYKTSAPRRAASSTAHSGYRASEKAKAAALHALIPEALRIPGVIKLGGTKERCRALDEGREYIKALKGENGGLKARKAELEERVCELEEQLAAGAGSS
jgi:hypothetical protein